MSPRKKKSKANQLLLSRLKPARQRSDVVFVMMNEWNNYKSE